MTENEIIEKMAEAIRLHNEDEPDSIVIYRAQARKAYEAAGIDELSTKWSNLYSSELHRCKKLEALVRELGDDIEAAINSIYEKGASKSNALIILGDALAKIPEELKGE